MQRQRENYILTAPAKLTSAISWQPFFRNPFLQTLNIPSLPRNRLLHLLFSSLSSNPNPYFYSAKNTHFLLTHHLRTQNNYICMIQFSSLLGSCKDLRTLKQAHASLMVSYGHSLGAAVISKLTHLYAKFNDIHNLVSLLSILREPCTYHWNWVLKACADLGLVESAFCVYNQMREKGILHDSYTFPIINRAVALSCGNYWHGKSIHGLAFKMGFDLDAYFCNTLIESYTKCGGLVDAFQVFEEMPQRDLVSWTSIISGFVSEGDGFEAFRLFREMQKEIHPNSVTIIVVLKACSSFVECIQVHCCVIKNGLLVDPSVRNSILKNYSNCISVNEAEALFGEIESPDVVAWNIMISLYSSRGEIVRMIDCFHKMQADVEPSVETLTMLISGLANGGNLSRGSEIHCLSLKNGLLDDILKTSLLNFYAKCSELGRSTQLFNEITCKNCIVWSAMMTGFTENGHFEEAVELFLKMLVAGNKPVSENLENLVIAYTNMGALQLGKGVHGYLVRNLFYTFYGGNSLKTSILNMYIKCGSISTARTCFNRMVSKDVVMWTSMIEGYGTHGLGSEALLLFHDMLEEGTKPNSITILSLLSACSHSGLLTEGCEILHSMKIRFNVEPDLNHYTCIVDLLGRSGKVKEALTIIMKLVVLPDSRIWGALLSASQVHNYQKVAEYACHRLMELEPDNAGYYTLYSNVKASAERWDEVEDIRSAMKEKLLVKKPGWSCIEARGLLHGFVSGDRSHPQMEEIHEVLMSFK